MAAGRTPAETPPARYARFDRFEFDLSTRSLTRDGVPLVLGRDAGALLGLLVSRGGQVVAPEELRVQLAGGGRASFPARLDACLGELLTVLGDVGVPSRFVGRTPDGGLRFIATIRLRRPGAPRLPRWAKSAAAAIVLISTVAALTVAPPSPDHPQPPPTRLHADESGARAAYLNGRYLLDYGSGDRLRESQRSFEAALAADSQYAPAYVGLAGVYLRRGLPDRAAIARADEALARALHLDGSLAEAYRLLGSLRFLYYHDWAGADHAFRRALTLAPDDADALRSYAMFLAARGRHAEALERIRDAALSDPISPVIRVDAGMIRYYARDYAGAVEECRAAEELDPADAPARLCLLVAYDRLGLTERALATAHALAGPLEETPAGRAGGAAGHGAATLEAWWRGYAAWLADAAAEGRTAAVPVAIAYARSGQVDSALTWLERSAERGSPGLLSAGVDPMFDVVRGLHRFRAVLARLEVPVSVSSPAPAPSRTPFTHPATPQTLSLRR